jgi:hypothetical protein
MTHRDLDHLHKNSARDCGTSGRQTETEQAVSASPTIAIDQEARDEALGSVGDLSQAVGQVESSLARLTGFVGDDAPLAAAVLGASGISATEIRQQLPALRQAILDIPLMEKGGRSS